MEELIETLQEIQLCDNLEHAKLLAKAAIFKLQAEEPTDDSLFDVDAYRNSTETI